MTSPCEFQVSNCSGYTALNNHGKMGAREGFATFSSPQELIKRFLRGRFHKLRAFCALSSPRNSARSFNCRIRSPGL
eukprot:Gb_21609 [translate_table: standard]